MIMNSDMEILKLISYRKLNMWDVKRLIKVDFISKYKIVELSNYIRGRNEKVKLYLTKK